MICVASTYVVQGDGDMVEVPTGIVCAMTEMETAIIESLLEAHIAACRKWDFRRNDGTVLGTISVRLTSEGWVGNERRAAWEVDLNEEGERLYKEARGGKPSFLKPMLYANVLLRVEYNPYSGEPIKVTWRTNGETLLTTFPQENWVGYPLVTSWETLAGGLSR